MILTGNHARFHRWCLEKYDDPRATQWLKDRLFQITVHYYERHLPVVW
jgi:hypothetical protein